MDADPYSSTFGTAMQTFKEPGTPGTDRFGAVAFVGDDVLVGPPFDDNAADQLTGSAGSDWFFGNVTGGGTRDQITDLGGREIVTDTDP